MIVMVIMMVILVHRMSVMRCYLLIERRRIHMNSSVMMIRQANGRQACVAEQLGRIEAGVHEGSWDELGQQSNRDVTADAGRDQQQQSAGQQDVDQLHAWLLALLAVQSLSARRGEERRERMSV